MRINYSLLSVQVAYVLGQLQNKAAASALSAILRDVKEHPMVRHEAAEALGSIAGIKKIPAIYQCCLGGTILISSRIFKAPCIIYRVKAPCISYRVFTANYIISCMEHDYTVEGIGYYCNHSSHFFWVVPISDP